MVDVAAIEVSVKEVGAVETSVIGVVEEAVVDGEIGVNVAVAVVCVAELADIN